MNLRRFEWLGRFFAVAGVILSLCLVAYEMKLARDVAMADLYQQRVDMDLAGYREFFDGAEYFEALVLYHDGEELSFKQESMLQLAYLMTLTSIDSAYYQWELGLVPDDEWIRNRSETALQLQENPLAIKAWNNGAGFRQGFVDEIELLVPQMQDEPETSKNK
ncbi:hypothetical protein EY643_13840 [Halioglobus maricola]|uniref:Uncharacterized protein n=1 Tax=Halioglobus maricola TaxID=2601894 RepID=A0A5P9NLJ0_9GAMM|nr:hypothetical protein [Halioglobus maricola]QFU76647.1 hypothetical protein EY643_13840 [Halioglobus maricola]